MLQAHAQRGRWSASKTRPTWLQLKVKDVVRCQGSLAMTDGLPLTSGVALAVLTNRSMPAPFRAVGR